jgi:hypothetical protein
MRRVEAQWKTDVKGDGIFGQEGGKDTKVIQVLRKKFAWKRKNSSNTTIVTGK